MRAAVLSICGTLAVLAGCALATPALAAQQLEPGVHLDPGSPAEKQYVLTLNQARHTGSGSQAAKRNSQGSSGSSQLFGSGIAPPKGGGGSGTGATSVPQRAGGSGAHARSSHAHVQGSSASQGKAPTAAPLPLPSSVLRATHSQGSGDNGSLLALIGGGLAILVLGGFGGTVLRHSRRPTPSG